jgi:hypothetical protein
VVGRIYMFYTVYKITNGVNGKIYVGLHVTKNLDDDYLGSGKQIQAAVKKYGRENFKREYIKICKTPEEMYNLEAEIVNEEFVKSTNTYNMKTGGTGSWSHVNSNPEQYREARSKLRKQRNEAGDNPFFDPEWQKKNNSMNNPEIVKDLGRRANTPEAIAKKKATWQKTGRGKGSKNSQFGTCWIYHSKLGNKKISKEELDKYLSLGYNKGRKILL